MTTEQVKELEALEAEDKRREREYCAVVCKGYQNTGGRCYCDGRCEAFRNHFSKIV